MSQELASKLKEAREKLGLSQSQAAKAWDIPLSTLQHWEQDERTPRGLALRLLMEKLDAILVGS
jgi:DNA-binding transcriptional regulator YiaG